MLEIPAFSDIAIEMNSIFLIGIAQAIFFVFLLLSKRNKSLADKVLMAWLIFLAAHLFMAYGNLEQWYKLNPHWLGLSFPFPLAEGPFFFLYVLTLTRNPARIRWQDFLHFLPFLLFYLLSWDFLSSSGEEKLYFVREVMPTNPTPIVRVYSFLVLATGPIYAAYVLWQVRAHRRKIRDFFSYSDEIDLTWIHNLAVGMILIWVVVWLANFIPRSVFQESFPNPEWFIFVAVTLFVFAIGYFGFRQGRIFSFRTESFPESSSLGSANVQPEKYQKSGLKDQANLLAKLSTYMEQDKPYLNPQLTLGDLAQNLGMSPHHLSQLINEGLNQNFFEFINQARVSAFKRAISQPKNQHLTLLAIALDCGFNSKSSFNRIFKQMTNQTPSQYARSAIPKD